MEIISVIIPVYNAEKWLRDALDSLQAQTYENFEAILVDDGSTDSSHSICLEYCQRDPRFKLISQPNSGLSAARNAGIDIVRGKWISFLDADDTLSPDALALMRAHAERSGAGIVTCSLTRDVSVKKSDGEGNAMTTSSDKAILTGLYQKKILNSACGKLFRTSIFNGQYPLRFRHCWYEDLDLFYQAFERTDKVCILDRTVYFYRNTPGSFINTWSNARFDVLDVTDRIVEHMTGRSPALLRAANDRRFSAHFNILVEMLRNEIDNPEQKDRCIKVIKEQRLNELLDGKVRLKNKLGALISYLGMPAIRLLCKF